jgi:hypothetical protein
MTEADWLSCADPKLMLEFVRGKVSERKLRLFACSCCRRVEPLLNDEVVRNALDAAERYADGQIRPRTVQSWRRRVNLVRQALRGPHHSTTLGWSPGWLVCHAVTEVLVSRSQYYPYLEVHQHTAQAVAGATRQRRGSPAWHTAFQAESAVLSSLLRDIAGNPFRLPPAIDPGWLRWGGGTVGRLAAAINDERRFTELPVLADALEDAGCTDAEILNHCRSGGEHTRGCWLVDLLLNKS